MLGLHARASRPIRPRGTLDLLLPPRCLGCGGLIERQGGLCPGCWTALRFAAAPWCRRCGLPFEVPGADQDCEACIRKPPRFDRARSVLAYDDASRDLILRFKHADRTLAAGPFARWMVRAGAGLWAGADLLTPVPLHRWRLVRRRYNQAALLAHAISRETGIPAMPDLLRRTRPTRNQGGLSAPARAENVHDAFAVRPRHLARLNGLRVVLVDDVFTTGATVETAAAVLLDAGAAAVDVVTLARVARPRPLG